MIDTTIQYLRSGLCVLPAILEEKRPALTTWKEYQHRLPTERQLRQWFTNSRATCILCGTVSGHLEMIDFDHAGELFEAWRQFVASQSPGLVERLVIERSQSGGRHALYRCSAPVPGNLKLAQRRVMAASAEPVVITGKQYASRRVGDQYEVLCTLIETRGEGGLFLCDPTPGYVIEQGSLDDLSVLSERERAVLIEAAYALNEVVPPVSPTPGGASDCGRPGDVYNDRGDVGGLLGRHGWTLVRGSHEYWRRPGKELGWSATLRNRVFYVFSSNAAPFEPDCGYSLFHVYTLLEHQGDFSAAARVLREQGFGDDRSLVDADVDISGICGGIIHNAHHNDGPAVPDPGPMPEELLRVPGFISQVMDECLATAPYPNPVIAFSGAIALQAFLAGRKVRDPGDNRTNLYLLGLAHSSAGKDWPRKINTRILYEIGQATGLGEQFASGEGIQDAMFAHPCMLFQTDEIDGILQSMNKSQDARYENIMSTLLTLYSSANTVFPMRRKAGKELPGVIDQPCLTIFGTAIPNHYYAALSERMLTNGFFARMLILECGKRCAGQEPTIRRVPASILEIARWWAGYSPGTGNLESWHPVPAIVDHTQEACLALVAARKEAEAEYARAEHCNDPVGTTVWGRVSEHTRKLALLYAISENHQSPEIGKAAIEWAVRFVMHQTRRMLFMAQNHVADNPFEAECLKFLQKLRDAPDRSLPHSVILKRMKIDSRTFQKIAFTLEQRGDITTQTSPTAGRQGHVYALREGAREPTETG
jgi:hypothetical protein